MLAGAAVGNLNGPFGMGRVVTASDRSKPESRIPAAFLMAGGFIVIALAIGGAGNRYPMLEMAAELASLPLLFYYVAGFGRAIDDPATRVAIGLAALMLVLPLFQLVPLAPEIWTRLPGRSDTRQLLELIGAPDQWLPLSLDPESTWRAGLALLPGFAAFLAVLALRTAERAWIVLLVIGFAVASAAVGALQAAGLQYFILFDSGHAGLATGLFTNRNHQALFLNIAGLLAAASGRLRQRGQPGLPPLVCVGLVLLFAAGVLATGSRTGVALLLLSVPLALMALWPRELRSRRIFVSAAGATAVAIMALATSAGETALARFASLDDARFAYWVDVRLAIAEYWPVGSGFGTFATIYQRFESLAGVGPSYVNHAHNDFLELLVEGGLLALAVLVAAIALLVFASVRLFRVAGGPAWTVLGQSSAVGLLIIVLHSVVDYPLRMVSLTTLFGILSALLFAPPGEPPSGEAVTARLYRLLRWALAAAIMLALAGQIAVVRLAASAVLNGNEPLARALGSRSPHAQTWIAGNRLSRGDVDGAIDSAMTALRIAPVQPRAISILAAAQAMDGKPLLAARLMDLASRSGWRDPIAQLWVMHLALQTGHFEMAAQRADALLRQRRFESHAVAALRLLEIAGGQQALADRLAENPAWRRAFLTDTAGLAPSQLPARTRLLLELHARGEGLEESEIAASVNALTAASQAPEARSLWLRLTRTGSPPSAVSDGSFERIARRNGSTSPVQFEWKMTDPIDADMEIAASPGGSGGQALRVTAGAGAAGTLLEQVLTLDAGRYLLSFEFAAKGGEFPVRWSIICADGRTLEQRPIGRTETGWSRATYAFSVPAGCRSQQLRLQLTGRNAGRSEFWLDEVAIERTNKRQ